MEYKVGQIVRTVYGKECKIVKVNATSVLIAGNFSKTIKVLKKHLDILNSEN